MYIYIYIYNIYIMYIYIYIYIVMYIYIYNMYIYIYLYILIYVIVSCEKNINLYMQVDSIIFLEFLGIYFQVLITKLLFMKYYLDVFYECFFFGGDNHTYNQVYEI